MDSHRAEIEHLDKLDEVSRIRSPRTLRAIDALNQIDPLRTPSAIERVLVSLNHQLLEVVADGKDIDEDECELLVEIAAEHCEAYNAR